MRKLPWTVGVGLLLLLFSLALVFLLAGINSRIAQNRHLPVYGEVVDFTLTNLNGTAVSLADLRGHAWVADIIFTRCPGPCLRMTRQMKELQDALAVDSQVRLVSLTTDPEFDTPPVLGQYAGRFGVNTNRWMFLTGTKKQIGDLATGGLKLSAVGKKPTERESADDLFIHSTMFVVVDKRARLRGVFETGGEGVDWRNEKQKILAAVKQLEREK